MVDLIKERKEETDAIREVVDTLEDIIKGKNKLPKLGTGSIAASINADDADKGGDDYSAAGSSNSSLAGRDIEKANLVGKKKASKKMKKVENFDQYSEALGANE